MDSTRISIARLLALDVPLAWQDAVAVVHEIAMLNDVTAVMNNRPPLVGPETCFLTRTGEVELPETADTESPEAVPDLLRLLLAGREAPTALEDLAFGRHSRDLTTDLASFSVGNRRAVIARLATKALALQDGTAPAAPTAGGARGRVAASPIDDDVDDPLDSRAPSSLRPVLVPPPAARMPIESATPAPSVVVPPPFQASPRPSPAPPVAAPAPREAPSRDDLPVGTPGRWSNSRPAAPAAAPPPAATGSELELRRLRQRQSERARAARRWPPRLASLTRSLGRWVTWRPATPNPLVIGASVVLVAAVASVLWRRSHVRPAASAPASTVARPPAPITESAPVASTAPAAVTPAAPPPAASTTAAPTAAVPPPLPRGGAAATTPTAAARIVPPSGRSAGGATTAARARPTLIVRRSTPVPDIVPEPVPAVVAPGGSPPAAPPPTVVGPRIETPATPASPAARGVPGAPPASQSPRARAVLYSANDADVEPPVMRRQQLPSSLLEPSADAQDDWPFLEILIDTAGAVEQVRLHARQLAPGQTLYRHRMLLAAAKAWQFEPARRNGEAVRYVMRVPLEP